MPSGAQLVSRLEAICGSEHLLTQPHALAPYSSDGLAQYRQTPLAAVLPAPPPKSTRSCGMLRGGSPVGGVPRRHQTPRRGAARRRGSAENSGGAHCFRYGFTTNYVPALEVVLSDGSVVEVDRDAPGYDLEAAVVIGRRRS